MKTIFLKIDNKYIYFNETDFISIEKTNLPHEDMSFNTEHKDIFWEVEIKSYDKEKEELLVNVIDYNPKVGEGFKHQKPRKTFDRIQFELLDWNKVEPQLSSYKPIAIKNSFVDLDISDSIETTKSFGSDPILRSTETIGSRLGKAKPIVEAAEPALNKIKIEEVQRINIMDFSFHEGFVSTSISIKNSIAQIEIIIHNSTFRKEFEYIKNYFVRFFGRKTVKVFLKYEVEFGKVSNLHSRCPDLEGIDDSIIEAIKVKRTNILRKPNPKQTKSILDLEEIFLLINDPFAGKNIFEQSEKDILDHFINIEGIRNKPQLSFLAYDLHQSTEKIRFTIHPIFGFIFFYETNISSYFIWELLDSHATYIWFEEDSKMSKIELYSEIEKAIEYIKSLGRANYKQAYKEGKINSNIQFKLLTHNRTEASGFSDWQEKLKSILR